VLWKNLSFTLNNHPPQNVGEYGMAYFDKSQAMILN